MIEITTIKDRILLGTPKYSFTNYLQTYSFSLMTYLECDKCFIGVGEERITELCQLIDYLIQETDQNKRLESIKNFKQDSEIILIESD